MEIPREIMHMLLFTLIAYNMIDLNGSFEEYLLTLMLSVFAGGSFGYCLGSICKTTVDAAQMVPGVFIPLLMFSDSAIPLYTYPDSVLWLADINPLYYIVRCFYIIEWEGAEYERRTSGEIGTLCNTCTALETNYYEALADNPFNNVNDTSTQTSQLDSVCSAT